MKEAAKRSSETVEARTSIIELFPLHELESDGGCSPMFMVPIVQM